MTAGTPVLAMLGVAAKSSQEVGVGDGDVFFWSSVCVCGGGGVGLWDTSSLHAFTGARRRTSAACRLWTDSPLWHPSPASGSTMGSGCRYRPLLHEAPVVLGPSMSVAARDWDL